MRRDNQIDLEDIYVAKLREARKKYDNMIVPGYEDMAFTKALLQYVTGDISEELRGLSGNTRLRCAAIGTAPGMGLMYPAETRSISVTDTKGVTIGEDIFDLLGAIRNKLVLNKAGARFLTGLSGDVRFCAYSGSNVKWAGEADKADDGSGDFTDVTLSPKRLTSYVDISKQMLIQAEDNIQLSRFIMNDFAQAIASTLQATVLGSHTHADNKPDGIFTGATLQMTGDADYKKIIGMQAEVYDGALSYCYITNNAGYAKLKGTLKVGGVSEGFIVDQYDGDPTRYCADYPLLVTNDIPDINGEHGIVFGDFSELVIGQWGDLDITVDHYTKATDGMIRLVVNTYFDAAIRRDSALALGSFK